VLGAVVGDDLAALAHDVADQLAVGLRDEVALRDEGGVGTDPMDDEGFLGAGLREVPEGVEGELLGRAVVSAPFLTNAHGFSLSRHRFSEGERRSDGYCGRPHSICLGNPAT
jgi:hypothetical protein